ncbi:MAG: ABC transporter substrate-binding protein [Acidimicrobiia bacterium]
MRHARMRFSGRALGAMSLGLVLALGVVACGDDGGGDGGDGEAITVAAADFGAEPNILAQLYGQALAADGFDVTVEETFGTRPVILDAMESGDVGLTPEYVGSLLNELEGQDTATSDVDESVEMLQSALGDDGLVAFEPSDAQDFDTLVVTQETADEFGLETYSDLADVADELTFGAPPECQEFPACIPGLRDVYGIEFGEFVPLEAGPPIFEALGNGDIDVARAFSTSPIIAAEGYVVLEDDQGLSAAENIIPIAREEFDTDAVADTVNEVSAALTTENLTELVSQVDIDLEDPADVAQAFLEDEGII